LFLIFGTLGTFGRFFVIAAYKLQGSINVVEGEHQKKFFHPYMQCFTMFIGEFFCILVFWYDKAKHEIPLEEGKKPHSAFVFVIPAIADACASTLGYMSLCFI